MQQNLWRKLRRDGLAVFGMVIISLAVIISIFAYLIVPDGTPNADLQTVEIQAKKPGYKQLFLRIPNGQQTHTNLIQKLAGGAPTPYDWIPITQYKVQYGSVLVSKFVDDDTTVQMQVPLSKFNTQNKFDSSHYIRQRTFLLGTDSFGRDILSRLAVGTRVSLAVGLIAVIISLTLGILLGALAGYYRGKVDDVITWFVNVTWSIPTLLLVFAITLALGKGFWQIFIAVGLTLWVNVARLVRGQVMAIREMEYVQAAKALGIGQLRIIFRHILPNILGPLMVIGAGNFATAIIIEAGLSFLGIGVQPPQPSWGLMIKENYNFIITNNPFLAIVPGIAIMLLVLAFNLLGNGLRDAFDVKTN